MESWTWPEGLVFDTCGLGAFPGIDCPTGHPAEGDHRTLKLEQMEVEPMDDNISGKRNMLI